MATSAIAIRLDTAGFKNDLKALESQFSASMKELVSWQEKSNQLTKKTIDLEKQLADARKALSTQKRGTESYKAASAEVKRLTAALRSAKAEKSAAVNISRELGRQIRSQAQATKNLSGAIGRTSNKERKANAVRNESVNTIVRKIRQLETMIVAFYTLKKAYDFTLGASLEYNAMIEQETIGLKLLINQTTEYRDAQGKIATGFKAMALAGKEAQKAIEIVKEINVSTPHTFQQTLSIFKLITPQVKKFGGSLEDVAEITKNVSILAKNMGVEYQEILKVVDSLFSGQMHESGLKRALAVVDITNDKIRRIRREGGNLVKYFKDNLEVVGQYGQEIQDSYSGVTTQLQTLIEQIRGDVFKGAFEGIKDTLKDINKYIRANKDDLSDMFKNAYEEAIKLMRPIAAIGTMLAGAKLARMSGVAKVIPPQLKAVAVAMGSFYAALEYGKGQIEANRKSLEKYYDNLRQKSKQILVLKDENIKKDQELLKKLKETARQLGKAYKSGDSDQIKALQKRIRDIATARRALRESLGKLDDTEYKGTEKKGKSFLVEEGFKEQLNDALKYARLKHKELTGEVSSGWATAQEAVYKYQDAVKKLDDLKKNVGKPGIDQEELKKKILEANVGLVEAENNLINVGNKLNADGLKIIEAKEKERAKSRANQLKELEDLKNSYLDDYAVNEKRKTDYLRLTELYNAGIIGSAKEYNKLLDEMIKKWGESTKEQKKAKTELEELKDFIGSKLENAMTDTFRSWMDGAMKFKDLMIGIAKDIAAEYIRINIIKPFVGSLMPSAHGNVFSGGQVQAFASGGIVTAPTIFPMATGAGLMGEAGPEAIMPLTRVNGDLGVKAIPAKVVINVQNETGLPIDMEQIGQMTGDDGSHIISVVMRHAQTNPDFRAVMGIK